MYERLLGQGLTVTKTCALSLVELEVVRTGGTHAVALPRLMVYPHPSYLQRRESVGIGNLSTSFDCHYFCCDFELRQSHIYA